MIRISLGALAWGLFLVSPALAWLGVLPPTPALALFALGALLGVVAALTGCIAWARGKRDGASGFAISGVAPLVVVMGLAGPGFSNPRINDITTDLENPPAFTHAATLPALAGEDLAYPESFKAQVREGYPDLGAITVDAEPAAVYEKTVALAKERKAWTVTHTDDEALVLEGYATTAVFKWNDDFVVRVTPAESGAQVDMRSRSREGQGDLGANAARIKRFLHDLETSF